MIPMDVFAGGMAVLSDRFNRALLQQTQLMYREILSRELTPQEFTAAVGVAFRECTFWPSPKELVEFIHPPANIALQGAQAFDRLLELGERGTGGAFWRKDRVADELGSAGEAAFAAIGANGRLRSIEISDLPWARREFIAAYKNAAEQLAREDLALRALSAGTAALRIAENNSHAGERG